MIQISALIPNLKLNRVEVRLSSYRPQPDKLLLLLLSSELERAVEPAGAKTYGFRVTPSSVSSLHTLLSAPDTTLFLRLPDPSVVCGHGAVDTGPQESGSLHAAPQGGGHERGPEGGRRDGCHAGPRGGLLHQVRGLQLRQDGSQVRS